MTVGNLGPVTLLARPVDTDGGMQALVRQLAWLFGALAQPKPLTARGQAPADTLSSRDCEISQLVAAAHSSARIAGRLGLSERAVEAYYGHIRYAQRRRAYRVCGSSRRYLARQSIFTGYPPFSALKCGCENSADCAAWILNFTGTAVILRVFRKRYYVFSRNDAWRPRVYCKSR